jgi:hypothetical protein
VFGPDLAVVDPIRGVMGLVSFQIYLWCVAGVVISVVLPILPALLPRPLGRTLAAGMMAHIRPYLITGIFAAIAALVVVAIAGDAVREWNGAAAFVAGYTWDSTLQKLRALY